MRSTFWPNRIFKRQSCQNRHTGLKFSPKRGKQCAFHENCTKRSFQVMRSTFWPNCICERQSCQNRHTGLKSSSKREKSALFTKIVQNARFRSCAGGFAQIVFFRVKLLKIARLVSNSLQNGKTVRFSWKLYKTLFSGHAQHVLAKSHFKASKLSKSSHWPQILSKIGERVRFSWKLYKTLVSGHTQHVLAKSHFRASKLSKSSHWPQILSKTGKAVRFLWKLYKTLVSGHAQHVLAKSHFKASKLSKSSHWPQILSKTGKQCAFHENCTKRSFQVMRSTFWPNRIFERQSCQNRHTGLKSSSKRENSALSIKIVQNALFRSCAARFGQIAFLSVIVAKIVPLASNSLQTEETVRFSWKLDKTLVSGHAQHVLAKLHLWAAKLSKSSHWPEKLVKTGKECAFYENCTKRSFQVMRRRFCPNRIFQGQTSQNR